MIAKGGGYEQRSELRPFQFTCSFPPSPAIRGEENVLQIITIRKTGAHEWANKVMLVGREGERKKARQDPETP